MRGKIASPYLKGQMAACLGLLISDNPFAFGTDEGVEWFRGYGAWERDQPMPKTWPGSLQALQAHRHARKD